MFAEGVSLSSCFVDDAFVDLSSVFDFADGYDAIVSAKEEVDLSASFIEVSAKPGAVVVCDAGETERFGDVFSVSVAEKLECEASPYREFFVGEGLTVGKAAFAFLNAIFDWRNEIVVEA